MSYKINNASNHIQWQIIRKNSSFLKRQRGIPKLFSTEKFNTQRINSLRYNGLINKKAVDVQPTKDGNGITVTLKKKRAARHPAKSTTIINFTKDSRRTLKSLKNVLKNYNPVTSRKATLRASQYLRAVKPKTVKPVVTTKKGDV